MHIGHGSHVVATIAPSRKISPTALFASRIAFTSACAVMSVVITTVLCEHDSTLLSRAIAQPNGLCPAFIPWRHLSIANRMSSEGSMELTSLEGCRTRGTGSRIREAGYRHRGTTG